MILSTTTTTSQRLFANFLPTSCTGHGSNGTMVFRGLLDGRTVAVKRMLSAYLHSSSTSTDSDVNESKSPLRKQIL
jgi:hypothetical protein